MNVHVPFDDGMNWRKATRSNDTGGNCVCVCVCDDRGSVGRWIGRSVGGSVGVRDSKDPNGGARWFPAAAWTTFINGAKQDKFGG